MTDINMLLLVEKGIRGGVCTPITLVAVANFKDMPSDKFEHPQWNAEKPEERIFILIKTTCMEKQCAILYHQETTDGSCKHKVSQKKIYENG
jgi:hypothetical protein